MVRIIEIWHHEIICSADLICIYANIQLYYFSIPLHADLVPDIITLCLLLRLLCYYILTDVESPYF